MNKTFLISIFIIVIVKVNAQIDPDYSGSKPFLEHDYTSRSGSLDKTLSYLVDPNINLLGSDKIFHVHADNRINLYIPKYNNRLFDIFDIEQLDLKELVYRNNHLEEINLYKKKFNTKENGGQWNYVPLVNKELKQSTRLEYVDNKLSLLEAFDYENGKRKINYQYLFGKGNSPEFKIYTGTSYRYNSNHSGVDANKHYVKYIHTNDEEQLLKYDDNLLVTQKVIRKSKLIYGKSRVYEEISINGEKKNWKKNITYSKEGELITKTTINSLNPNYLLKEVFNENDQLISKGIIKSNVSGSLDYYLVYNTITYSSDYISIREYRNTDLTTINLSKNLKREIQLFKNSFNNKIRYDARIGKNKVVIYSTIHEDYLDNKIIREKIYLDGEVKDIIEYFYQTNDNDIIEKIEGIVHSSTGEQQKGLIFLYKRTVED